MPSSIDRSATRVLGTANGAAGVEAGLEPLLSEYMSCSRSGSGVRESTMKMRSVPGCWSKTMRDFGGRS